jgi:glycosyltransferase involved in cell wall biosynthesis
MEQPGLSIGYIEPWDRCAPPNPGGSLGLWTWEVARRLAPMCDVLVCGPLLNGAPAQEESEGVHFVRFPLTADAKLFAIAQRIPFLHDSRQPAFASPLYRRMYARRAAHSLRLRRCGVIHIFNHFQFVPLMHRLNPQSRIVLHMQCDWLVQLDRAVLARQLRDADVIAGCSDYVTDAIRGRFPEYAGRCWTIYNGVDTAAFHPRETSQDKGDGERIIFVNRISPEKGLHVLLEAFKKIAMQRPKAVLEIIGPDAVLPMDALISLSDNPAVRDLRRFYPGSYRSGLQRHLQGNLDGRVVFLGALSHQEVAKRIRQANVLAQPSVFDEPFGMPIVEAMACGLPTVASAVGGIRELVVHGLTGILVERNDPLALADAVIRLLDNPDMARSMGGAGRARAEAKFSWEQIIHSLSTCYFGVR